MPDEYFVADGDNAFASTIRVFNANRIVDAQKFDEALIAIEALLNDKTVINFYKKMLEVDRAFIHTLQQGKDADYSFLDNKETGHVMKAMANFPAVLRFEYTKARLHDGDEKKAQAIKDKFEKVTLQYPYKATIASEKELMDLVDERYQLNVI
jgi:hypothetical protein